MKHQPQQPYTLPSRSKANRTSQNLSKSMAARTLREKKARAYNNVYKSLGNKWLNEYYR